jgi:hypothetical protein
MPRLQVGSEWFRTSSATEKKVKRAFGFSILNPKSKEQTDKTSSNRPEVKQTNIKPKEISDKSKAKKQESSLVGNGNFWQWQTMTMRFMWTKEGRGFDKSREPEKKIRILLTYFLCTLVTVFGFEWLET